jgi:ribosomal protein S18 acetylase RimI-like enzyme
MTAGVPTMVPEETFEILASSEHEIGDDAIHRLLWSCYVDGEFTAPDVASAIFAPDAVRARGTMLVALRVGPVRTADGMVIVVPPTSPARRIARLDEIEMHLLAVDPQQRGHGLGRSLVERALLEGRRLGGKQMVLWTQPTMYAAQRLYVASGFTRAAARDREIMAIANKPFLVFERPL